MKQLAWALVIAAGREEKLSPEVEIPFLYMNDRPVLAFSLAAFEQCPDIDGVVVVVSRERADSVLGMVQMLGFSKVRKIVPGGVQRARSMAAGLEYIPDTVPWVCVHDASRPVINPKLISDTVKCATRHGSGLAAVEMLDTLVESKKVGTASRLGGKEHIWGIISPQTYPRAKLLEAYASGNTARQSYADDAEAMAAMDVPLRIVPTHLVSPRIRSVEDLSVIAALMKQE